eukprot:COSAG02_NODE_1308_length_13334_cov_5.973706_3_plen_198_part_00
MQILWYNCPWFSPRVFGERCRWPAAARSRGLGNCYLATMVFQKLVVVDTRGHLLGRLASLIAKELLLGQHVVCVRCEEINISGTFMRNKRTTQNVPPACPAPPPAPPLPRSPLSHRPSWAMRGCRSLCRWASSRGVCVGAAHAAPGDGGRRRRPGAALCVRVSVCLRVRVPLLDAPVLRPATRGVPRAAPSLEELQS